MIMRNYQEQQSVGCLVIMFLMLISFIIGFIVSRYSVDDSRYIIRSNNMANNN
jgi:hypothetical protein